MNKWYEFRLLLDNITKYIVLLLMISYIGDCVRVYLETGKVVNMPDWIVSMFTVVILYFFRRSPKKEGGANG